MPLNRFSDTKPEGQKGQGQLGSTRWRRSICSSPNRQTVSWDLTSIRTKTTRQSTHHRLLSLQQISTFPPSTHLNRVYRRGAQKCTCLASSRIQGAGPSCQFQNECYRASESREEQEENSGYKEPGPRRREAELAVREETNRGARVERPI